MVTHSQVLVKFRWDKKKGPPFVLSLSAAPSTPADLQERSAALLTQLSLQTEAAEPTLLWMSC